MLMNVKKTHIIKNRLIADLFFFEENHEAPVAIYVDRHSFMSLLKETDGTELIGKLVKGVYELTFRKIPIFQVQDHSFHMEFRSGYYPKHATERNTVSL